MTIAFRGIVCFETEELLRFKNLVAQKNEFQLKLNLFNGISGSKRDRAHTRVEKGK